MDACNYTSGPRVPVNVSKSDFVAMPSYLKRYDGGPQLLRMEDGRMQFTPVHIVECPGPSFWSGCVAFLSAAWITIGTASAAQLPISETQLSVRTVAAHHAATGDYWHQFSLLTQDIDPALIFDVSPTESTEALLWAAKAIASLRSALALFDNRAIAFIFQTHRHNAAFEPIRRYAQGIGAVPGSKLAW